MSPIERRIERAVIAGFLFGVFITSISWFAASTLQ